MSDSARNALAEFIAFATVPSEGLHRARDAVLDTVGVMLAGSVEPSAHLVQTVAAEEGGAARCRILGTAQRTSASWASLANGTAAHALDYDDMCFVSLAHPSAPLVAAGLAIGEMTGASGRAVLEAYVVGFEVEAVLGRAMNPSHYKRGWHCTSTLGTIGTAAASARLLALNSEATLRCLSIAASEASGLKENFGTMVKPLHAGLAARNGVLAALLAGRGFTAADRALDGPQGFLTAMDAERSEFGAALDGLGSGHWEILRGGITTKLYPSCAATHPALDAVLDLRTRHNLTADQVEAIEIQVDSITPTVLIYDRPKTALEAKFSMPFCVAAAAVYGQVDIDTFDLHRINDPRVQDVIRRVSMLVDPDLGKDAPTLTQATVTVRLRDGQIFGQIAHGARGYPDRPASREELDAKFRACATRAIPGKVADEALSRLQALDGIADIRTVTELLGAPEEWNVTTPARILIS
jgi:2-methylcitrate dehydratase PrpD